MLTIHRQTLKEKAGITFDRVVRNIGDTYARATTDHVEQGLRWYPEGRQVVTDIAERGGISVERAAIVVAHLSPRTTWHRNIAGAYQLVTEGYADHCMERNVIRANAALDAADPWQTFTPEARKIRRFAMNLCGQTDVVTVDVWACRVALGDGMDHDLLIGRQGVYEAIEAAYLKVAASLGQLATTVQATCWIVARNGRSA